MVRNALCSLTFAPALLACIVSASGLAHLASAQPSATHSAPGAILPIGSTRVVVHGDKLKAPLRVWTTAPLSVTVVDVSEKQATLDITPKQELSLGPFGLWLATSDGVAAPLALLVDELPSAEERVDNRSPITAQTLGMSAAIDATSDGKLSDYFRFHAHQGQEISFEILAEQFGSPLDPVVRLLTEDARELANVDDEAVSADCRFRHRFEKSGNYLLEIHDNRYAAGGRYRVRIGNFPFVAFAFPPVVQRGTCAQLSFAGFDRARMAQRSLLIPDNRWQDDLLMTAPLADGSSAAWATLRLVNELQLSESEPNDSQAQANAIDAARGVSGLLEGERDSDWYKFSATKEQLWRFAATSRSFGSATLLKMTLRSASGDVIGKTNVGDSDEWQFDAKFPADGDYFLEVEDLLRRNGPEHGYHISIGTPPPFSLSLKADPKSRDRFAIQPTRGAAALDLVIQRGATKGPIELRLEPPVSGLKILNPTIAAEVKDARVYLTSESGWSPETLVALRVIGQAAPSSEGEPSYTCAATTTALLALRAPQLPYPPAWQDGVLVTAAVPDQAPLVEFSPASNPVPVPRPTAEASIALTMKRSQADYKESPTLVSSQLPDKWSASAKADKDNMVITLKHPVELTEEQVDLKFVWYAELGGRGAMIESTVPVKLFDPLTIAVAAVQPLKAGASQMVTVELMRAGGDAQPVVIKFQNLPAGVTAAETTLPAAESKVEVLLTAAADAALGKVDKLTISAQTKFGSQEITAQSAPFALEVQAP